MHFFFNNINEAFRDLVSMLHNEMIPLLTLTDHLVGLPPILKTTSRVGDVYQITEPVTITYLNPCQRVLFNQARDANPFFHVAEACHFLCGRNTLAELKYYVSTFDQFSDDGKTLNGAYGYRWRNGANGFCSNPLGHCEGKWVDQLEIIIDHLKRLPDSRRAVLSMWNVEDDLLKIGSDLDFMQGKQSKDVCCNLSATFQICNGKLDMTVFNRSNDMIWGSMGANAVHFSVLLEYVAAHIGVPVGVYNQISTNLHVYTSRWEPDKWLADETPDYYASSTPFPLVQNPQVFDEELPRFFDYYVGKDLTNTVFKEKFKEPWIEGVAKPMVIAFYWHKQRDYVQAWHWANGVVSTDWRMAAINWLTKRRKGWEDRNPYLDTALSRMEKEAK